MNKNSYSMMVDREQYKRKRALSISQNSSKIRIIEPRIIPKWINDEDVNECYNCKKAFSFLLRKHHCRSCGRIFCYYCCNKKVRLPRNMEHFPEKPTNNLIDLDWLKGESNYMEKVCGRCHKKYSEIKNIMLYINVFNIIQFDLKDFRKIGKISKKFQKASMYCLSYLREIQYYLPTHKYTEKEKKILFINRKYFSGHSKWILHLIKSTSWDNNKENKHILKILKCKKNTSCWNTMCSRYCKDKIGFDEAIEMLEINNEYIKKYAIYCISKISEKELECYLFLLVDKIKYDLYYDILTNFLILKSLNSKNIRIKLYWYLTLKIEDKVYGKHYLNTRSKMLKIIREKYGDKYIKEITLGYKFVNIFTKVDTERDDFSTQIKNLIIQNNLFTNDQSIVLPINPNYTCKKVLTDNIIKKKSATAPLLIHCIINEKPYNYKIIFKQEDVRKDIIISNIIQLMDIILKKDLNLDLNIISYNVLPINSDCGLIEIVPNAHTLYEIKEELNFSLQNYILNSNKQDTINSIRKRFMKSTAAYCVITYLLGIGDRHLDNIMVTNDGVLFHIDYGFILGLDPKPLAPSMRITREMVDAIGGINSSHYHEFQEICSTAYNCLRRNCNIFMNMLLLLPDASPPINKNKISITRKQLKDEIVKRFLPGQNYTEAKLHLAQKMDTSSQLYSSLIDFFHYHNKEDSFHLKSILNSTIKTADKIKSLLLS